jgi:hypothetical protein
MALTPEQEALNFNPELQDVSRQRKLAEALMTQGLQGQPQGQMISGHYVGPSWSQMLNPMANVLAGQAVGERADTKEQALADALRGKKSEVQNAIMEKINAGDTKGALGISSMYPEYKNKQSHNYEIFIDNIENSGVKNKIIINRGYSNIEIPKFQDDFFDIIYIDGNHEPEYVLEDAVLSFRKLKKNGMMIFDDYGWGGPDLTQRGIDGFLSGYHKRIEYLGESNTQVFIKKL